MTNVYIVEFHMGYHGGVSHAGLLVPKHDARQQG